MEGGQRACSYSLNPTSNLSAPAGGGIQPSINVSATSGCVWGAASNAFWITFPSGASGTGNGTLAYTLGSNSSTSSRSGAITVTGQGGFAGTFNITQLGASQPQYSGFFDGAGCNVILGWAWDASNPNATASVDIYDGSTL